MFTAFRLPAGFSVPTGLQVFVWVPGFSVPPGLPVSGFRPVSGSVWVPGFRFSSGCPVSGSAWAPGFSVPPGLPVSGFRLGFRLPVSALVSGKHCASWHCASCHIRNHDIIIPAAMAAFNDSGPFPPGLMAAPDPMPAFAPLTAAGRGIKTLRFT